MTKVDQTRQLLLNFGGMDASCCGGSCKSSNKAASLKDQEELYQEACEESNEDED